MKHETAGDPIRGLKWTRKTTEKIAAHLGKMGISISPNTVGRLLKGMGFSLRVNHKKRPCGSRHPPPREVRDQQFEYIHQMRETFASQGLPVLSVDAKKKEMIGNFKHAGKSWEQAPYLVNDHDFRSDAAGAAVPYGIYEPLVNRGFVVIGTHRETASFAVDAIELWWKVCAAGRYPQADELLILADCGGGNNSRSRAWKYHLQCRLCNRHGLRVTVCHYPPGASKWNPIEHRLFSEISKNWAGKPLESYETILKYIRTTRTSGRLRVGARLLRGQYEKGEKISDAAMANLVLSPHDILPNWNYTFAPWEM